ncbi:MAG TPA: hypothetical protein VKX46_19340 [Ktedonobacteraceae bacterium]|nr:hypothetical protein [Ktedonobacteraceae bacterium]
MRTSWLWPVILIFSTAAAALVTFVMPTAAVTPLIVMWFLFVCPGMALVRAFHLGERMIGWTLGVALSFAVDAIVVIIFLYAHFWSLPGMMSVLLTITLLGACAQLIRPYRSAQPVQMILAGSGSADMTHTPTLQMTQIGAFSGSPGAPALTAANFEEIATAQLPVLSRAAGQAGQNIAESSTMALSAISQNQASDVEALATNHLPAAPFKTAEPVSAIEQTPTLAMPSLPNTPESTIEAIGTAHLPVPANRVENHAQLSTRAVPGPEQASMQQLANGVSVPAQLSQDENNGTAMKTVNIKKLRRPQLHEHSPAVPPTSGTRDSAPFLAEKVEKNGDEKTAIVADRRRTGNSGVALDLQTFVTPQNGWGMQLLTAELYMTNDGGQHWRPLPSTFEPRLPLLATTTAPAPASLTFFQFFSAQDGMLHVGYTTDNAARNSVSEQTLIYTTHDGGVNWRQTGTIENPINYTPHSATLGVLGLRFLWYQPCNVHTRQISISIDEGRSWQTVQSQAPTRYLRVTEFRSPQLGRAYGYNSAADAASRNALLLTSNDGGQSWREAQPPSMG